MSVIAPTPAPLPPPLFTIVAVAPAANGIVTLPRDPFERTRQLTIEFEFTWPDALIFDNDHAQIDIAIRRGPDECLGTDLGYATRLDRDDSVYVARSVARFRTGNWYRRDLGRFECGSSFTSNLVQFTVRPNLPGSRETRYSIPMSWNFEVR